jgi:hypothetical protein
MYCVGWPLWAELAAAERVAVAGPALGAAVWRTGQAGAQPSQGKNLFLISN